MYLQHIIQSFKALPEPFEIDFAPLSLHTHDLTRASVLIPIICHDVPTILLTQRSPHLKSHAGQISFPGGQWEPEDKTPIDAALRETQEEIGVLPSEIDIIRDLGCWPTHSGFLITPVLGLLKPNTQFTPCEREVAGIFEVPLNFLMTPNRFQQGAKTYQGKEHTFYHFDYENKYVWGFTAGILKFLVETLS